MYRQNFNHSGSDDCENNEHLYKFENRKQIFGSDRLVEALFRRQRDTGWGYPLSSLIPLISIFVGIYYAFSRATITPFIYYLLVLLPTYFLYLLNPLCSLLLLILIPWATYNGINKARLYARDHLRSIELRSRGIMDTSYVDLGLLEKKNSSNFNFQLNRNQSKIDSIEMSLQKLKSLYERKIITEEEYQAMRKKTLGI